MEPNIFWWQLHSRHTARKHVINAKFSENCILTFTENYVVASFLFGILLFLSMIFLSHNQAPVVQKMDNAISWINLYSVDNATLVFLILIHCIVIYLVDKALYYSNNHGQGSKVKLKLIYTSVLKPGSRVNRINNDSSGVQSVIRSLCSWPI